MKKSRRKFIKNMAGGMAVAGLTPSILNAETGAIRNEIPFIKPKYSANDTIRIAGIGMGIQGYYNMKAALQVPGIELVAVCDLYDGRLESCKENYGNHLFTTRNYKEILERKDIDAVLVATSDHWHDRITIDALNAGKHVYCEKPMVHKIEEGMGVVEAQKRTGKVLQIGSQRASSIAMWKARELVQQGAIGELILAEAWYDRHSHRGAWNYSIPTDASTETIDWGTFIGDAPKRDFDAVRFFRWRNFDDYGTGVAGDLYVHLFTQVHTVLDSIGPERIYASSGLRYWKDGRDAPDIILGIFDYPETKTHPAFHLQLRSNFVDGGGGGHKMRFVGSEGVLEFKGNDLYITNHKLPKNPGYGGYDSLFTFTKEQQAEFEKWYKANYADTPKMIVPSKFEYLAPEGYNDHVHHWMNFADSIRNGTPVHEDGVFGLRAAAPSLACNMSAREKRVIDWDPVAMKLK